MIVLDGAHNPASVQRLSETVKEQFDGKKLVVVFGASEDKDIARMFAALLPEASGLVLVRASHPRAAPVEKLEKLAADYACEIISTESEQALETACELSSPDGIVLVTGSLYLVGEIRPGLV
jgi:dihydrofolate synthase/folylpolyglutamate synthase